MKTKSIFTAIILLSLNGIIFSQTTQIKKIIQLRPQGYYAIVDSLSGKVITALKYDYADNFTEGLALVKLNNKCGFINTEALEQVPLIYDEAYCFTNDLAPVKTNNKWGFVNKLGKMSIPATYDDVYSFKEGLAAVKLNNKWGYIDKLGKIIIPLQYDEAQSFSCRLAAVSKSINGSTRFGYIDKTGKVVIPFQFIEATKFRYGIIDNYAIVMDTLNYEYSIIDDKGGFNTKAYNGMAWTENSTLIVRVYDRPHKWGVMTSMDDPIVPIIYKEVAKLAIGPRYMVKDFNNKIGIYDFSNLMIPVIYDFIVPRDSLFFVNIGGVVSNNSINGGKNGIYNYKGEKITEVVYDYIGNFVDNMALVVRNGKMGFINKQGKEIIEPKYDYIHQGMFYEGLATVNIGGFNNPQNGFQGGKWGFIDKSGKFIIDLIYDAALVFKDGVVSVKKGGLVGVIDAYGKVVVPFDYQDIGVFSEGVAYFVKDNLYGFIDKTGKIVLNNTFQYAGDFNDGMAMVAKDNKVGYINKTGNIIIPIQYDNGDIFVDGYAIIVQNGQNHLINKKGEIIK